MSVGVAVLAALVGCRPPPPEAELQIADPARSMVANAGVLVTAFQAGGDAAAILLDGAGTIRWYRPVGPNLRVARVRRASADSVWLGINDPEHEEDDGTILRETFDGDVLSETVGPSFHHDLVPLPDGRIAALGHVFADRDVPGHGVLPVGADVVRVGPPGGALEVVFDFFEDYGVAPYWTCPHMLEGIHIDDVNEWTHTNSLVPAPDGGWYLMPRYLDAIVKLSPAFAVEWQLGGKTGDVAVEDGPLFQHAHMSDAYDDHLLVFDNGWDHVPDADLPAARVVEIEVTDAGSGARSARIVWSHTEPAGRRVGYLGDAKRLPNGNTLVAWGNLGDITEVTPEGEVVWQVALDRTVGRAELWRDPIP